jgi:hypothetical protein
VLSLRLLCALSRHPTILIVASEADTPRRPADDGNGWKGDWQLTSSGDRNRTSASSKTWPEAEWKLPEMRERKIAIPRPWPGGCSLPEGGLTVCASRVHEADAIRRQRVDMGCRPHKALNSAVDGPQERHVASDSAARNLPTAELAVDRLAQAVDGGRTRLGAAGERLQHVGPSRPHRRTPRAPWRALACRNRMSCLLQGTRRIED